MAGLGLAPVAKKTALTKGVPPVPLAIAVTVVAAAAALVYFSREDRGAFHDYGWQEYFRVFLVGVLGSGAVVMLGILALQETSATNRSLFQAMYPVATAICARLILGECLKPGGYVIIVAMSLGLVLMNTGGNTLEFGVAFWLLASTLPLIGLSDVFARRSLCDVKPGFVAAGRLLFGLLALVCLAPLTDRLEWSGLLAHPGLVLLSGLAMAAGSLGLYQAMNVAGASMAAAFVALAPLITAGLEWIVFGATFSALQLIGIGVTVTGAVLLALRR